MSGKGIYDIHCHIVPGVDDGAIDIEETNVTAQPSATYEAQQAMAEAVLQKLQELNYISKG